MKKRLSALFMAFVMTMSLAAVAFAADGPFTVTFNLKGHGSAIEAIETDESGVFTMPADPTDEDYDFGGWYTDTDCTEGNKYGTAGGAEGTATEDITLYAKWTAKEQQQEPESTGTEATMKDGVLGGETVIEGEVQTAIIKVIVPSGTSNGVIINPYQLQVKVGDAKVNSQIISPVYVIENHSNVAIKTGITVVGATSGDAVLATAPLKGTETTKSIFMYFEIAMAGAYNEGKFADPQWAAEYAKGDSMIAVSTTETTLKNVPVMPAATFNTEGTAVTAPTGLAFHLAGGVATTPATAWAETDTVTVTIAYTFTATVEAQD